MISQAYPTHVQDMSSMHMHVQEQNRNTKSAHMHMNVVVVVVVVGGGGGGMAPGTGAHQIFGIMHAVPGAPVTVFSKSVDVILPCFGMSIVIRPF